MVKILSIHPAIGIARVGNSQLLTGEGYFIGPEVAGFNFTPQAYDENGEGGGSSRDRSGAVRRQGARFRIYEKELDEFSRVKSVREITSDDAEITWQISLANTKASGLRFPPYFHDEISADLRSRNPGVADRASLEIRANARISIGDSPRNLEGSFLGEPVNLGHVLTDDRGRLVVLGGAGHAASPTGTPLQTPRIRHSIYNCDGWYDDTSDGQITATVQFPGQPVAKVDQRAWVIVGPPDFAPAIQSPITLYDVVYQANLPHRQPMEPMRRTSFSRDVFPLLKRAVDLQWVSASTRVGHSGDVPGNFLMDQTLQLLSENSPQHRPHRERFFNRLTPPGSAGPDRDMPNLYGGVDPRDPTKKPPPGTFGIPLTVTPHQYEMLKNWVRGDFDADWAGAPPVPPPLDEVDVADQPDALDQAALETCVGGSFHPGIEASFIMALESTYDDWFRIAATMASGDLTQYMAVPWHTDFLGCSQLWWPGQRPNSVKLSAGAAGRYVNWDRGVLTLPDIQKLGFIKRDDQSGEVLETERLLPEPIA